MTWPLNIQRGCLAILAVMVLTSCNRDGSDPAGERIAFSVPDGWPAPVYDFASNPVTRQGFELGKRLFFDGRLSLDGNFPCGSCHQPFAAFANFDHAFSHGFNNQFTTRNAPALYNLAWLKEFHHDGAIPNLDLQPLAPITAPNEMAETLPGVLEKLQADPDYPKLFKAAFGSEEITVQNMTKALSQFELMLISDNSKYDRVMRGTATFDVNEAAGYELFKAKQCTNCHTEPLFTNNSFEDDGLPIDPVRKDSGRMRITGRQEDYLKFKVPSLRNVAVTFPYMHDGRFNSLAEVLEHYDKKIPLSQGERGLLTAFFRALTDSAFISNPLFSPQQ
ncbi:cytochrome-c peroxidase [Flavihumibacter petaseus]|uniref:Putative cytochrome c peroxidase n=1 Tax=Flavihumibacter petaseus NBRC 106054 TaxID=1220578 RepID=A0A0E9MVS7_9BACT|nr:cytochrome c peroxidase [Flavihumibacter petaseus]GAO41689.1 putative cytochrome c peroxidase [Flavihumibacter petaseus NBRC 106054]